jgi:hypothetical protein
MTVLLELVTKLCTVVTLVNICVVIVIVTVRRLQAVTKCSAFVCGM